MADRTHSAASLGGGLAQLGQQEQPTTPTRVGADSCLKYHATCRAGCILYVCNNM